MNKDERNAYARKWYAENKDRLREELRLKWRVWQSKNPEKRRFSSIKSRYGITREQWNELFIKQGKACAVCRRVTPDSKVGWHTDHDHKTGKVRGILCAKCNRTVGYLESSVAPLAQEYIVRGGL